jgi:hypothetical protein
MTLLPSIPGAGNGRGFMFKIVLLSQENFNRNARRMDKFVGDLNVPIPISPTGVSLPNFRLPGFFVVDETSVGYIGVSKRDL